VIRDSGLKVGYHIMPGLPGASREHDLETLRRVFEDERFRPDYLKIYPTLVVGGQSCTGSGRMGSTSRSHARTQ
jgi:elongator complex protein 3